MTSSSPPYPVTAAEFLAIGDDGQKADLIDGTIYPACPDTPNEDQRAFLVRTLIQQYADLHGLGETYGFRVAFLFSRYRCLEPDISFVTTERLGIMEADCGRGALDLVIEFVTPQSAIRDYILKRVVYEGAGVQEYWIIDPLKRHCLFLQLTDGQFVEVLRSEGQIFRSRVLSGFWLDVEWLFAEPLPNPAVCWKQIQAGSEGK